MDNNRKSYWECICTCWNKKTVMWTTLTSGKSKSCGCYQKDNPYITHWMSHTIENKIYRGAKSRCKNKNNLDYKNYWWRWIRFLFKDFEEFYNEIWPRPSNKYSLDRINNDWNYEPWNIRWASRSIQNRNTRKNINISYKWKIYCATDLDRELWLFKWSLRRKINDQWYSHSEAIKFYTQETKKLN